MKKIALALFLSAFFMSCSFANDKNFVTVRNETGQKVEAEIWPTGVSIILENQEEVELLVKSTLSVNTPFGVACVFVTSDNTLELHRGYYYWGEDKKNYWNE